MKRISFILSSLLLLSLASCDKIDSDKYIVFAGANGTWYDSEMEIPSAQRAFIEKYTGVRCVNCPMADEAIHAAAGKYGDALVVAAIHAANNFGKPLGNDPDLRTEKGNIWFNEFIGSLGLPATMINRNYDDIFTPTSGLDDRIEAIIAQPSRINMLITSSVEESKYVAEVHLGFAQDVPEELSLTVLVVEDKIYTTQMKQGEGEIENYEQNHVLRDIITDAWGIDVDANGQQGTKRMVRLNFELRSDCVPENCHLVAFVSDKATRKIINAAQCDLL